MSRAKTLAQLLGSDGVLNVADLSGLAAIASSGSASDLTTGTLPNARLAAHAARDNLRNGGVGRALTGNFPANTATLVCFLDDLFGYRHGVYVLDVNVNSYHTGGTYDGHFIFLCSFFGGSTNGQMASGLVRLHASGHALNNGADVVSLYTQENYSGNNGRTRLYLTPTENWSGLDGTPGRQVSITAYSVI